MELYGWDTCYLANIDRINAAMAERSSDLLDSLDYMEEVLGRTLLLHLELGPWTVTPGGSGDFLWMALPVTSGSAKFIGDSDLDLSGVTIVVQLSLRLVSLAQGSPGLLTPWLGSAGHVGDPAAPGLVIPIAMNGRPDLDDGTRRVILDATAAALVREAGAVSLIFASVNLAPPGGGSWMAPVQARYAYVVPGGAPMAYLAIFAVADSRDVSELPLSVDPDLVTGDPPGSFAVSKDLFLPHVVQPMLPGVYGGNSGSYQYRADEHAIVNTGDIAMSGITEGLITYTPVIKHLKVGTDNQGLVTEVSGDCDLKVDITMTWSVASRNRVTFDAARQMIAFAGDPNPTQHHSANIPSVLSWLSPIVGLITDAVVAVIADDLASDLTNRLAQQGFTTAPGQSVHWIGMRPFTATSAGVNQAYFVRGIL